jgi:hypothetical protein
MLEVVERELDPHTRTGALISGAPESFVVEEASIVGHLTDPIDIADKRRALPAAWEGIPVSKFFLPRTMSIRQAGKKGNHGLNYNMKYKRFALENGMEERDALRMVNGYHKAYPNIRQSYYKWIMHRLRRDNRRLTNCFGQTRKFMGQWDDELLDAAFAFLPQSTVGNITGFGFRSVYDDCKGLADVVPKAQVHDSLLNQHTFSTVQGLVAQIWLVSQYMATPFEYFGREYTIRREIKLGFDWGESSMIEVPTDDEGLVAVPDVENALELARAAQMR